MSVHLGIDLGTSSVKCVLLSSTGETIASSQVAYAVERAHPGWAEQDPEEWWSATVQALRAALRQQPSVAPRSIGLSGQMHGVVLLDLGGRPVRPAIIWPDARSGREAEAWRAAVGERFVTSTCGMPIATGLAGVSLSWLANDEPDALARTASILQPKDWIRFCLTGELALEPTDACASLLFSVIDEQPVPELLRLAGVQEQQLPPLVPSLSIAGFVTAAAAAETGLPTGVPVAAGGGDQAMAALALGLEGPDRAAIAISSSGTAIVPIATGTRSVEQQSHSHHVIAAAQPGARMAMGVVLAAGLATRWLADELLLGATTEAQLLEAADAMLPGAAGLSANPHLGGTRTPVVDSSARGAFVGLGFPHTPAHLMRAIVDGVAISLTDSVRSIQDARRPVREIVLSGGGARFTTWHRAIADASGLPVVHSSDLDHSPIGAALAGALAAGDDVAFDGEARISGRVEPDPVRAAAFRAARERAVERGLLSAAATPPTTIAEAMPT
ncbi:FGGY family carbohydrate kinase [Agrococcus sp. 1P02AA]|uniref:xylulokinase n=1 Tax=Agrococcus sp. 1P02AA TaxID=3132259 RepID=UPI0039A4F4C4